MGARLCCGRNGLDTDGWTLADAALGAVVDGVLDCLGAAASAGSSSDVGPFLAVCRWWFSVAVCRPGAFRAPVRDWHADACRKLDEQFARMGEPPWEIGSEDLHLVLQGGLEHAEQELRLTELSASFPSGITVVLLRFARRLGGLLRWVHYGLSIPAVHGCPLRRRYLQQEAEEFKRRAVLLSDASRELRGRLPDPEMPLRWAEWFEETGAAVGFPEVHLQRFRSQREQVAAVWANNRRTFLSADEHVEALLSCSLDELDDLLDTSDDEGSRGSTFLTAASHQHCLQSRRSVVLQS